MTRMNAVRAILVAMLYMLGTCALADGWTNDRKEIQGRNGYYWYDGYVYAQERCFASGEAGYESGYIRISAYVNYRWAHHVDADACPKHTPIAEQSPANTSITVGGATVSIACPEDAAVWQAHGTRTGHYVESPEKRPRNVGSVWALDTLSDPSNISGCTVTYRFDGIEAEFTYRPRVHVYSERGRNSP